MDEPVEGGLGGDGHCAAAVPVGKDLRDQGHQALDGALGAAALAAQRFLDGGDDAFVGAPGRHGPAGGAVVDQPPQALLAVGQAHALHRGPGDRSEADRGQLRGLGLLALREREPVGIVLGPGHPAAVRPAGQAGLHLADVPLPGQRLAPRLLGRGFEQTPLRHGLGHLGAHDGEARVGEQMPDHDRLVFACLAG